MYLFFKYVVLKLVTRPLGHLNADTLKPTFAHVEPELGLLVPGPEMVRKDAGCLVLDWSG